MNGLLFVVSFIFGRPLIVLTYVFAEWGQAVKNKTSPTSGYAAVETWACAASEDGNGSAHSICTELKAERYLLIPVLVLSLIMWLLVLRIRLSLTKEKQAMNRTEVAKDGCC